jgi:hypothetical protein
MYQFGLEGEYDGLYPVSQVSFARTRPGWLFDGGFAEEHDGGDLAVG